MKRKEPYPFVLPNLEDWPIVKLTKDKPNFLKEISEFTTKRIHQSTDNLHDELAKTIYLEKKRAKEEPWRVDPRDERKFWKKIQKDLVKELDAEEPSNKDEILLRRIIDRYAQEITGNFKIKSYWFARRVLTFSFTSLLNAASGKNIFKRGGMRYRLQERIVTLGEIDHIRELSKKGTIILVPTHFSNLDSILIGLALDFVGLPAFSYGAGLNLFNTGILAYFMNRLGAYRLDRRKKNKIYIETLKAFSNLSIQRGTHSLFFPGGTRSRSGALEKKLKMGLLSTTIEAQRSMYENGADNKVFIVPMVLNYHFVLEAKSLIRQHLKRTGKEQYITKGDEFRSYFKIMKFIWQFFSSSSEIIVQLGKPMDVLGNSVDLEGNSIDKNGNKVAVKDYFMLNGQLTKDYQREGVYTKMLANRLVKAYLKENIVLSSHLIAFTAFNMLKRKYSDLDIYAILRLSTKDIVWEYQEFFDEISQMKNLLMILKSENKLKLSETVEGDIDELIKDGIANMGIYHIGKPLKQEKNGDLITEDLHLLYYYHNRMTGYGFEH